MLCYAYAMLCCAPRAAPRAGGPPPARTDAAPPPMPRTDAPPPRPAAARAWRAAERPSTTSTTTPPPPPPHACCRAPPSPRQVPRDDWLCPKCAARAAADEVGERQGVADAVAGGGKIQATLIRTASSQAAGPSPDGRRVLLSASDCAALCRRSACATLCYGMLCCAGAVRRVARVVRRGGHRAAGRGGQAGAKGALRRLEQAVRRTIEHQTLHKEQQRCVASVHLICCAASHRCIRH